MRIDTLCVGVVQTNCYIISNDTEAMVIDPGDNAERILQAVGEKELKYVLLTHSHFDHILAAEEICKKTGAKLCASKHARLDDEDYCGFTSFGLPGFSPLKADILLSEGDEISVAGENFTVIETPGHTPCSICLLSGDVLIAGDTLFEGSCGRCDLVGGSYSTILKSLEKLSHLPGSTRVYSGHGAPTTIENERKFNPYMREAMQ